MSAPRPADAAPARGLVLVVEDEPAIADVIRLNLAKAGYGVQVERDGLGGAGRDPPHAAGRDHPRRRAARHGRHRGLPAGCATAQDWTPVLFVTARDDEVDRIVGLELGADDYVTKPFSPRELVARVTRRAAPRPGRARGGAADRRRRHRSTPDERRVFAGDREFALTATEFDLLAHLMRRPGRVFTREQLLSEVWGYSSVAGTRTVDVHIAQLRAKLGDGQPDPHRPRGRLRRRDVTDA